MKRFLLMLFVSFLAIGFTIDNAEAARFGGGRSFGMQRQVAPRPAPTAPRQANPGQAAGKPAAAPTRSWLGPLAGLAAGLGLAALFSHLGLGEGLADIVMLGLLLMLAVTLFKKFTAARQATSGSQVPPAGSSPSPMAFNSFDTQFPSSSNNSIPQEFDTEAFLRIAKLNFVRLQAANDEGNLADIREFVSPEIYAEIKLQLEERGSLPQHTDVVTLQAELMEVATENGRHIASVQFSGMIREEKDGVATPFNELWVLAKPVSGNQGWVVSGIQQA